MTSVNPKPVKPNGWLEKDFHDHIHNEPHRWNFPEESGQCTFVVYTYRRSGIGICVKPYGHDGEHDFV